MKDQRAVITGMGAVTPLGSSIDLFWTGLRMAVNKLGMYPLQHIRHHIGGQ